MLNLESRQIFSVPPRIKLNYEDFKLIAETSSYQVFVAQTRDSYQKHTIRILDRTKEFVRLNPGLAATLFIQELLRLQQSFPGSVLINTLEFSDDGATIACALLACAPLSSQFEKSTQLIDTRDPHTIKKLLSDVLTDVEFLWSDLKFRGIMNILTPENICYMREKSSFFLSNWAQIFEIGADNLALTLTKTYALPQKQPASQDLAAELNALALVVLKISKIDYTEFQMLQRMPNIEATIYEDATKSIVAEAFKDSKELQDLVSRMLSIEPKNLPSLEEFKIKGSRVKIVFNAEEEGSKRAKTEAILEPIAKKKHKFVIIEEKHRVAPQLMAWCSARNNMISIIDLEEKEDYAKFEGTKLTNKESHTWTHLKEIPNTRLLVSVHHSAPKSAHLEIFDVSQKGQEKKVYSFEEVFGSKIHFDDFIFWSDCASFFVLSMIGLFGHFWKEKNDIYSSLVTGDGDVSYNLQKDILGAISVGGKTSYHLFNIMRESSKMDEVVRLSRKSKWHLQYTNNNDNVVTGLDFSYDGSTVAAIDRYGVCVISDLNTDDYRSHLKIGHDADDYNRCRWTTNFGEPLLFVKYNSSCLNLLDVEKKCLLLKDSVAIDESNVNWIDVCPSKGDLLSAGGSDYKIKIYDRRESKIVQTFDSIHSSEITCVRWHPSGDMIASSSSDTTAKSLDFKTGKILYSGMTSDKNEGSSLEKE